MALTTASGIICIKSGKGVKAMNKETLRKKKEEIRAEIKKTAAELPASYFVEAGAEIVRHMLSLDVYRTACVIMAYWSMPGEPPTRDLIKDALEHGKTVLLPRCVDKERMIALPFTDEKDLQPGKLGIPEPVLIDRAASCDISDARAAASGEDPAEAFPSLPDPDLIIVPCVAASADGRRLGHGAGYYDRFLTEHKSKTVCLCFGRFLRDDIPVDENDVMMDLVLTEEKNICYNVFSGC